MKPILLTMQAFGSYGKKTTIDFRRPNQNLFLITGDTGSGKTTIFDAIVFALYGHGSGADAADGARFQSQYADLKTEPYVELRFEDKGKVYTIDRHPRHLRAYKRGEGTTMEREKVSLMMPDGTMCETREINRTVEEIIGLDRKQFMQVGMIAQGEFIHVLRASSDERKVIFRKLFHTDVYRRMIDELKKRKNAEDETIQAIRRRWHEALHQVQTTDKAMQASIKALSEQELNADMMTAFLAELEQQCTRDALEQTRAETALHQAETTRDAARSAYAKAENLQKSFASRDEAEKELEVCRQQEKTIQQMSVTIHKADEAFRIRTLDQLYQDQHRQTNQLQTELQECQAKLPQAQNTLKQAQEQLQKAEETKQICDEAGVRTDSIVNAYLEMDQKIREADQKLEQTRCLNEEAQRKAKNQIERYETWQKEIQAKTKQRDQLQDVPAAYARWQNETERLDRLQKAYIQWKQKESEAAALKQAAAKAQDQYLKSRKDWQNCSEQYQTLHTAFLDAQAGILAREALQEGKPCPVCGSLDHPHPCDLPEDLQDLSREAVQDAEKKAQASNAIMSAAAKQAQTAAQQAADAAAAAEQLYADLEQTLHLQKGEQAETRLTQKTKENQEAGDQLMRQIKQLKELQAWLQEAERLKTDREQELTDAKTAAQTAADAYLQAETQRKMLKEDHTFENPAAAEAVRQKAQEQKAKAAAAAAEARRQADQAQNEWQRLQTLIARDQKAWPAARQEEQERLQKRDELIKRTGQIDWEETAARFTPADVEQNRRIVNDHQVSKAKAEELIQAMDRLIGAQVRPDLEALKARMITADSRREQQRQRLDDALEQSRNNHRIHQQLEADLSRNAEAVKKHRRLQELYAQLAGNVSGSRMDLETYAQRIYLEQILEAANERFREMTDGAYELRMVDLDKAGTGKNRGLDFMVYSSVNEAEREVSTLSGGESFMAALSLALGMADTIRAEKGSIDLDMLFIDEGFGSLDDHARDQAVRILQKMAGTRQIGIISHVTELKQEIEDQLIVFKDSDGSHVHWQIS